MCSYDLAVAKCNVCLRFLQFMTFSIVNWRCVPRGCVCVRVVTCVSLIFQRVHQHAQFSGYFISSVHASFIVLEMVKPHVDCYSNVENSGKC